MRYTTRDFPPECSYLLRKKNHVDELYAFVRRLLVVALCLRTLVLVRNWLLVAPADLWEKFGIVVMCGVPNHV